MVGFRISHPGFGDDLIALGNHERFVGFILESLDGATVIEIANPPFERAISARAGIPERLLESLRLDRR